MPVSSPTLVDESIAPDDERPLDLRVADFLRLARTLAGRGDDILESLSRAVQTTCGVDVVIISQIVRQPMLSARSLVWLDRDVVRPPMQWSLPGTPCEGVVDGRLCSFGRDVQALFPDDVSLTELGVEAYLGLPLVGVEGRPIGLLTLLHRSPFDFSPTVLAVAELLASRAAMEIERVLAAQKRTSMEDRLELALRAAGMGAWHWDVMLDEVQWDAGLGELLGLTGERSTNLQGFLAMLPRSVRAQVGRLIGKGDDSIIDEHSVEVTVHVPGRGERAVRSLGRLFRDEDGNPERVAGVVWDVTREREDRQRLEQSERRYRGYFEHGLVGIAQISGDGQWMEVNDELCRILGVPREELLRHPPEKLLTSAEQQRLNLQLQREDQEGQPSIFDEVTLLRPDGSTVVASSSIRVLRDESGEPQQYLALLVDMSERRRLESQLVQSQKLEAVGRLAGGVAHDFNNVLAVVLSSATLLQGKLPENSPPLELVGAILDAAERGARMTRQLLAFARPQSSGAHAVDAARVVKSSVSMLRHLVGDAKTIELTAEGVHPVRIDEGQLEQVIMNLVVNARDATPAGGRIQVTVDAADLTDDEAGEVPGGRYVRLRVTDEGHGMTPEALERVFEPFFTTKSAGQGTGLGLATCHAVVKRAGGAILARSRPGEGSSFTVLLPEEALPAPRRFATNHVTAEVGSLRVLVVDDEGSLAQAVEGLLSAAGHQASRAASGQEALAKLEQETFDVVLSDVLMPGMTGVELCDEIRRHHPTVAVVLSSGQARPESTAVEYFLQKPYQVAELNRTLRVAVAARRAATGSA